MVTSMQDVVVAQIYEIKLPTSNWIEGPLHKT